MVPCPLPPRKVVWASELAPAVMLRVASPLEPMTDCPPWNVVVPLGRNEPVLYAEPAPLTLIVAKQGRGSPVALLAMATKELPLLSHLPPPLMLTDATEFSAVAMVCCPCWDNSPPLEIFNVPVAPNAGEMNTLPVSSQRVPLPSMVAVASELVPPLRTTCPF